MSRATWQVLERIGLFRQGEDHRLRFAFHGSMRTNGYLWNCAACMFSQAKEHEHNAPLRNMSSGSLAYGAPAVCICQTRGQMAWPARHTWSGSNRPRSAPRSCMLSVPKSTVSTLSS